MLRPSITFLLLHQSLSFTPPFLFHQSSLPFRPVSTCTKQPTTSTTTTSLYNVPPPSISDPESIKAASDKEPPPQSFYDLQIQSARATKLAMEDGYKLLEVEFPPLPSNVLEMDDVSAYDVSLANLKLAIQFSKFFTQDGQNVAILLPDEAELEIALEELGGNEKPHPGVVVSSLRKSAEGDDRYFKPEQVFLNLFGQSTGVVRPLNNTDIYIILTASAQELPDVEDLHTQDPTKTIIFYNLKLETLRGDLGAPAFPPKEFQDRFLSKVKPSYYLLPRSYTRSIPNPPFLLNYQGCLFRSYPGVFQTLLDTGTGNYRRIKGNEVRPALGKFKQELTDALQVEGVIEEEGKVLGFLRTGYKTTTWWEGEREDASDDWRT